MEGIQAKSGRPHATRWRGALLSLVLLGAVASAILILTGINLLNDIRGPECIGEFPVCTTPSQQSVRQSLAVLCGMGLLAYLLVASTAAKSRRVNWSHAIIVGVIVLAVLALIADPVSHLQSEAGSGQWFVASWPL